MSDTFTYAEVESLLAGLHGIVDEQEQRGAFRGRLKHLKRLGVPLESSPGRGQKTSYSREHLYQWSFCLSLEEFGIDPNLIVSFLKNNWLGFILPTYRNATMYMLKDGACKTYMSFTPSFVSRGVKSPIGQIEAIATKNARWEHLLIESGTLRRSFFDLSPLIAAVERIEIPVARPSRSKKEPT